MNRRQTAEQVAQLRHECFTRARGRCEWPAARVEGVRGPYVAVCGSKAAEMAHLHSRGMGGSDDADQLGNVMAACRWHARVSDGEGSTARADTIAMFAVVGYDWHPDVPGALAWHRAEALREWVATR